MRPALPQNSLHHKRVGHSRIVRCVRMRVQVAQNCHAAVRTRTAPPPYSLFDMNGVLRDRLIRFGPGFSLILWRRVAQAAHRKARAAGYLFR